jgi:aminoglycoside 3-N-acetyltransferase
MFGLYAYAMRNREAMRNALCGFTLDSIGMADIAGEKETFDFLHNPYVHPSWAHGLAYRMIAAAAERLKVGHAYLIGSPSNDDIIQDPLFGPAWCLLYGTIMVKSGVYHSNADTVGNLSAERMKELAALAGAFAASAADAGEDQAMTLARMASAYALTRAADRCRDAVAALPDSREALRERGLKLAAYRDMAVPAGVAAIQSAADLLPAPRRESFLSEVAPLAAAFRASAEGMVKAALGHLAALAGAPAARFVKVHPDRLEREAANAVVTRNVAGALGLGTLPPAARQEAARFAGYYSEEYWSFGGLRYFWFDGRRTVREAALAAWASSRSPHTETPGARNKALRDFVDLTAFLERHGCVRAERRPLAAPVTKDDIAAGLRRLGVESGDVVMVHSSLSQFGEVVGGPDAVIGALMDVITPRGVLAMPTFTNTAVGEADPPFDPATSVVYTGAVPEAFRSRPGVLRHGHPTHSIAAWGERAAEFLRCHDPYDTFDRRGPWGRLYDWDGKILCFGETMGANTYIHALEAWLLNYLDVAYARVLEGGVERQVRITNYPDGCRGGWYGKRRESEFFKRLNPQGVYRETRIGEAAALVARVRDFTGAMHRLFQEDPAILLHKTGCLPCAERRARLFGWAVPATTARAPRDERDQRSGIC